MGAAETLNGSSKPEAEELPRILIVDDHYVTAEIERNYLMGVGFMVSLAETPAQVAQLLQNEDFDLMIIDVNFAKKTGLTVLQHAKKVSKNPDIKAIVKSVEGLPAAKKKAEQFGADGYLVMPAPRPKFLKEIKKLTSQKVRDSERIKQNIEFPVETPQGEMVVRSLDLSGEGAHLCLLNPNEKIPVGTKITLLLPLGNKKKPVEVPGVVVRHTSQGFGVRFDDIGRNARRDLDKFLLRFSMEQRASHYYL